MSRSILSHSQLSASKSKSFLRNWNLLPESVLQVICTHFLADVIETCPTPTRWKGSAVWYSCKVFKTLRAIAAAEELMRVSLTWENAIAKHRFWKEAIEIIDYYDVFQLRPIQIEGTRPYEYFREQVFNRTCVVCRINYPVVRGGREGLGMNVGYALSFHTGHILCCKRHLGVDEHFCGVCLISRIFEPTIIVTEDPNMFRDVSTTCKQCREDLVDNAWKALGDREREAIKSGGLRDSNEWQVREAVESFIREGKGSISHVVALAVEKQWLRKNTKLISMLKLAHDAEQAFKHTAQPVPAKTNRAATHPITNGHIEDSEEEDLSEESEGIADKLDDIIVYVDVKRMEVDKGVRQLALHDWARRRIMDGFWVSPMDQWWNREFIRQPDWNSYTNTTQLQPDIPNYVEYPNISAKHPCPWTLTDDELNSPHPSPLVLRMSSPPSLKLCTDAAGAFEFQLKLVLSPAMTNIVCRVKIECVLYNRDMFSWISKQLDTPEKVVKALRDGRTWYSDADWSRLRRDDIQKKGPQTGSSTRPSGRNGLEDHIPPLPVTDRGNPLKLAETIRTIPFIPEDISALPQFGLDALWAIWRSVTADLNKCDCKICKRSNLKENSRKPSSNSPSTALGPQ